MQNTMCSKDVSDRVAHRGRTGSMRCFFICRAPCAIGVRPPSVKAPGAGWRKQCVVWKGCQHTLLPLIFALSFS